jgi:release factor glutamine methyltransferase
MTFRDILQQGSTLLEQEKCSKEIAVREALELFAHALGSTVAEVRATANDTPIPPALAERYLGLIARRAAHEPLAYLLGTMPFLGRLYEVTPDTLIPRPATENLVEAFLSALPAHFSHAIVDVGTGSGCIAVSCALARPSAKVIATDISPAALAVATSNAAAHAVEGRIHVHCTNGIADISLDWDAPVAIIANLPYLPDGMWSTLAPELTDWEPRTALTSGADGMDAYRELTAQLKAAAPTDATLTMAWELLPEQLPVAKQLLVESLPWLQVTPITNHQDVIIGILARP